MPTVRGLRALAVPLGVGAGFVLGAACARLGVSRRRLPWWLRDRDPVTGLATPGVFRDRLQNAVERRLRAPAPLAVLLVDLERVDDSGRAAGDAVLRAVARRLQACVRTEDTVARLGEAVFGVLLDDVGDGPVAALAERIRAAVGVPVEVGRGAAVRLDAGVAVVVSDGGHDADALLAEAEQRIGDIRSSGRGGVELVVVPFG